MSETRNYEAWVYDMSAKMDLGDGPNGVNDFDRMISEAVYKNKQHLGSRGMIECALVIAREFGRLQRS